jgi:hypothetical protein
MAKRLGVVLVFRKDVTAEEAQRLIQELCDSAVVDRKAANTQVREYDDEYGGPVWYIP